MLQRVHRKRITTPGKSTPTPTAAIASAATSTATDESTLTEPQDEPGRRVPGGGFITDPTSMIEVTRNLPDFFNARSLIDEVVERHGHVNKLSSKFHAEAAGQGIEYDFGRAKWYFRKHNRLSLKGLSEVSVECFTSDVITLGHCRKFARRCRDYHRGYRAGASGGSDVDKLVRCVKTHRPALDTDYNFVSDVNVD